MPRRDAAISSGDTFPAQVVELGTHGADAIARPGNWTPGTRKSSYHSALGKIIGFFKR